MFYGINEAFNSVALVKLGKAGAGYNESEELHEGRENIRIGVAGMHQGKEFEKIYLL